MAENTTTAMFVGAVKTCFMKYVDFKGRAPRSEYWWFYLFNFIVQLNEFFLSGYKSTWKDVDVRIKKK